MAPTHISHWYRETEGLEYDDGSTEVTVATMNHNLIEEHTKPVVTYIYNKNNIYWSSYLVDTKDVSLTGLWRPFNGS